MKIKEEGRERETPYLLFYKFQRADIAKFWAHYFLLVIIRKSGL